MRKLPRPPSPTASPTRLLRFRAALFSQFGDEGCPLAATPPREGPPRQKRGQAATSSDSPRTSLPFPRGHLARHLPYPSAPRFGHPPPPAAPHHSAQGIMGAVVRPRPPLPARAPARTTTPKKAPPPPQPRGEEGVPSRRVKPADGSPTVQRPREGGRGGKQRAPRSPAQAGGDTTPARGGRAGRA